MLSTRCSADSTRSRPIRQHSGLGGHPSPRREADMRGAARGRGRKTSSTTKTRRLLRPGRRRRTRGLVTPSPIGLASPHMTCYFSSLDFSLLFSFLLQRPQQTVQGSILAGTGHSVTVPCSPIADLRYRGAERDAGFHKSWPGIRRLFGRCQRNRTFKRHRL